MKSFEYLTPTGAEDAVRLLDVHGTGAAVIAGGQTLLLAMKTRAARPAVLVSIGGIAGLAGIQRASDGELEVGASTTYARLARTDLPGWQREIARMSGDLADRPVRTMGTIGGALCAAEPRFDMPVLVTGVDATLEVLSVEGTRELRAEEFFDPVGGTTLRPADLLVAVRFPAEEAYTGVSFEKFRQRTFDAATVSCLCAVRLGPDGTVCHARIAVGAVAPVPVLAAGSAAALVGRPAAELDLRQVGRDVADEVRGERPDQTETGRFQTELIMTVARNALASACALSRS